MVPSIRYILRTLKCTRVAEGCLTAGALTRFGHQTLKCVPQFSHKFYFSAQERLKTLLATFSRRFKVAIELTDFGLKNTIKKPFPKILSKIRFLVKVKDALNFNLKVLCHYSLGRKVDSYFCFKTIFIFCKINLYCSNIVIFENL